MADAPTPPEDRDRDLAARIGVLREQGRPLEASELTEDAVVRALLAYRDEQEVAPRPEQSERLWAAIEAETAASRDEAAPEPAPIYTLSSATRWAVAASVAIAAVLAWLILADAPEPVPVATATTSIATYTAPDGSTIQLRPHSTLYRIEADDARRYRLTGEALFDVTPHSAPFIVEAGGLQVQVLGTRFVAHTWGRPSVFLQEGQVRVRAATRGDTVTLQPGQRSTLTPAGALTAPADADSTAALDWLRAEMVLQGQPVGDVVDELEHHFDLAITLPDAVAAETLTGRIALETPQQSLDDLGIVLGGRFERVDSRTYRFVQE